LLETFKSENIVVMGDSAGASIALVLSQYLKSQGFPQPKHTIMFSPCFDISLSIEDNPNIDKDPMFYKALLKTNFLAYAGEEKELVNPLASPEFGDLKELAPMSVFIGTKETLYPYVQRFFEKIEKLGLDNAKCYPYFNLLHVFPLMPIPEAKDAKEKVKRIILS
jgi:acetyl esterase/lipase